MRRIALLCLGAIACAAATAGPASAQVQPAGTGEPLYTNSAQNTQWFEWPASQGADAYRIRYDYYENNTLKASPTVNLPGVNSGIELGELERRGDAAARRPVRRLRAGPVLAPERLAVLLRRPELVLDGHDARAPRVHDDRPLQADAALQLAAGADVRARTRRSPLRIDFADDVAGPFPANFLCFQVGGGPQNLCDKNTGAIYGHNPACSVPGSAGKSTTFTCTADYGQVADGNVWACVIAADASIPDNPNGPDQTATAEKANLSAAELRRRGGRPHAADASRSAAPPPRSRSASSCRSQASASDATSGLAGAGQWTWGDNTARRERRRRHAHLHAARHLRGGADRHRRGGQRGDGEEDDHGRADRRRRRHDAPAAAGDRRAGGDAPTAAAAPRTAAATDARRRHGERRRRDADAAADGGDGTAAPTAPARRATPVARSRRPAQRSRPRQVDPGGAHGERRAAASSSRSLRGKRDDRPRQRQARRRRHRRLPAEAPEGHHGGPLHAQGDLHADRRPAITVSRSLTLTGKAVRPARERELGPRRRAGRRAARAPRRALPRRPAAAHVQGELKARLTWSAGRTRIVCGVNRAFAGILVRPDRRGERGSRRDLARPRRAS